MLKEHEAARWLTKEQFDEVKWLPKLKQVMICESRYRGR